MNILVVSQYFWPEEFRINDLVAEWVRRGHIVTVLTGLPNYPDGEVFSSYRNRPKDFCCYHGAHIVRVPLLPRGRGSWRLILNYASFVFSAVIIGAYRLRGRSYDLIFAYEPSPVTIGLPAIFFRSIKKSRLIFWALDLWPETLVAMGAVKTTFTLRAIEFMVSLIYNRCDLILGQSQGFLSSIAKYCADPKKIRYFPSWAETVFSVSSARPAPEISLATHCFNVLFAGNVGEAQDFPAIVEAASLLHGKISVRWIIVGDGRKMEWLRCAVRDRGLVEDFVLAGRHPVERIPSFYAHADALLISLRADPVFALTIPGKVQSCLMAGLPILGMLNGEGARVLAESGAGRVCSAGDAQGLAMNIQWMAALSAEERNILGRSGRVYALDRFDRTSLHDRLEAWMFDLLRLRSRSPVSYGEYGKMNSCSFGRGRSL